MARALALSLCIPAELADNLIEIHHLCYLCHLVEKQSVLVKGGLFICNICQKFSKKKMRVMSRGDMLENNTFFICNVCQNFISVNATFNSYNV